MQFSLPGQLYGPECRRVVSEAVRLRRRLCPWFEAQAPGPVEMLTIILRVDGSLGSFGRAGVENVALVGGNLACDLVIADPGWDRLEEGQIRRLLEEEVLLAIDHCLRSRGIHPPGPALVDFLRSADRPDSP